MLKIFFRSWKRWNSKQIVVGASRMVLCGLVVGLFACNGYNQAAQANAGADEASGRTLGERFKPPAGYRRVSLSSGSFGDYLRRLPLYPSGHQVRYYHGGVKDRSDVYAAVVKMDIGDRDLQQCADAVIRLRAEYLYSIQQYDAIGFAFVSDGKKRYYLDYAGEDRSYSKFRKYLDYIFAYANTASLRKELTQVASFSRLQVGDVLVQAGRPYGHAVLVVDMAANAATGDKVYLLAQSYMPAQDIQILRNPLSDTGDVWYSMRDAMDSHIVPTPEWTFLVEDLRRF